MNVMPTITLNPNDLAHEINNQLSVISGHASLLQMSLNLTADERQSIETIAQAVRKIKGEARRLAELADTASSPTEPNQSIR